MTRRSGLTLVEVLTALFIMGLGVIAILTLFPLGAIQMGQAIRDNRCTEGAFNADQYMRGYWKTEIVEKGGGSELFYQAMFDPDGAGLLTPVIPGQPGYPVSYPVAVDPMGVESRVIGSTGRDWVGDIQTNVARRSLSTVTSPQYALRLCSLMDTMGFDGGVPNGDRELRYNWLWLLQLPDVANRHTANMTVVVFDRRAMFHTTMGAEDVLSSTFNAATPGSGAVPGSTSITFDNFNPETKIQPGTWIMDGTVFHPSAAAIGRPGMRHANFYRVVSVTDRTVELQTPIKTPRDNLGAYTATFIVWRGVSGVYVRSPATPGNN